MTQIKEFLERFEHIVVNLGIAKMDGDKTGESLLHMSSLQLVFSRAVIAADDLLKRIPEPSSDGAKEIALRAARQRYLVARKHLETFIQKELHRWGDEE